MKKWGLGIEHEMRIRFKNSISELPKDIINKIFPSVKDKEEDYIFISSDVLLYYFKMYEPIFMKDFLKYITNDDEKKYYNTLLLKKYLTKHIIFATILVTV